MPVKLKELPISERPYEKLEMYGAERLSNSELLAIIIKTGNKEESAVSLAQRILKLNKENTDISFLQDVSLQEFMQIKGIGKVKAIQLKAVCEIAKRIGSPINKNKIIIKTPDDVANLLMKQMKYEKREIVKVILLNNRNVVQRIINISLGTNNFAFVSPKEVLVEAIKMQVPRIILVHNHPSGDPTPSKADFNITDRIYDSAELVGIELVDHIIIGDEKFESIFYHKKYHNVSKKGSKENGII